MANATILTYRSIINQFIKETNIENVQEISESVLVKWRGIILSRATAATWNNYHRHLKAVVKYAFERAYIEENPFKYITALPVHLKKKKTVDIATLKFIINDLRTNHAVIDKGFFWSTLIITLYYTGSRRRQCVGLKWRDIDFKLSEIKLTSETSKTYREWSVPLDPRAKESLLLLKLEVLRNRPFDNIFVLRIY